MKLLTAAVAAFALSTTASADSRSWSAVKPMLPGHVNTVGGANLTALRGTSLYQSVIPQLIAKDGGAQKIVDLAKSTCALDLHSVIVDVTFAVGDDERGVLVAALDKSVDQKRLVDCAAKVLAAETTTAPAAPTGALKGKKPLPAKPAPKIVAKTTGKITEYGIDSDTKRYYLAWLAPDVVAIATDADDKPLLEKMIGGKGTRGTLAGHIAKASSNAAIWLASTKAQSIQRGMNVKGVFGTVDASRGNVAVDLSVVLSDSKEAKSAVDTVKALLPSVKSNFPAHIGKLIDAVKVTAAADAANFKLTASEKDIMAVVAMAMMNL